MLRRLNLERVGAVTGQRSVMQSMAEFARGYVDNGTPRDSVEGFYLQSALRRFRTNKSLILLTEQENPIGLCRDFLSSGITLKVRGEVLGFDDFVEQAIWPLHEKDPELTLPKLKGSNLLQHDRIHQLFRTWLISKGVTPTQFEQMRQPYSQDWCAQFLYDIKVGFVRGFKAPKVHEGRFGLTADLPPALKAQYHLIFEVDAQGIQFESRMFGMEYEIDGREKKKGILKGHIEYRGQLVEGGQEFTHIGCSGPLLEKLLKGHGTPSEEGEFLEQVEVHNTEQEEQERLALAQYQAQFDQSKELMRALSPEAVLEHDKTMKAPEQPMLLFSEDLQAFVTSLPLPLLYRDQLARENPDNTVFAKYRLPNDAHQRALKINKHSLAFQDYYASPANAGLVAEVEGDNFQAERSLLKELPNNVNRISAATVSLEQHKKEKLSNLIFGTSLLDGLTGLDYVRQRNINLMDALRLYDSQTLMDLYAVNKGKNFQALTQTELFYKLADPQTSKSEIAELWQRAEVRRFFKLSSKFAFELSKENVNVALFFLENPNAGEVAGFDSSTVNRLMEGWDDTSTGGTKHFGYQFHQEFMDAYNRTNGQKRTEVININGVLNSKRENFDSGVRIPLEEQFHRDQISFLIKTKRLSDVQENELRVSYALTACDNEAMVALFRELAKGNKKLTELDEADNLIQKALGLVANGNDTTSSKATVEKLAAMLCNDSAVALAVSKYYEKQYSEAIGDDKKPIRKRLVQLACADKSGKIAESLLKSSFLHRYGSQFRKSLTHVSNALDCDDLQAIWQAHEGNPDIERLLKKNGGSIFGKNYEKVYAIPTRGGQADSFDAKLETFDEIDLVELIRTELTATSLSIENLKAIFQNRFAVNLIQEHHLLNTETLLKLLAKGELSALIQLHYPLSASEKTALAEAYSGLGSDMEFIPGTNFSEVTYLKSMLVMAPRPVVETVTVGAQDEIAVVTPDPIVAPRTKFLQMLETTQLDGNRTLEQALQGSGIIDVIQSLSESMDLILFFSTVTTVLDRGKADVEIDKLSMQQMQSMLNQARVLTPRTLENPSVINYFNTDEREGELKRYVSEQCCDESGDAWQSLLEAVQDNREHWQAKQRLAGTQLAIAATVASSQPRNTGDNLTSKSNAETGTESPLLFGSVY